MGYAFISYSTKNQQMADSFKTLFNKNGIETWMAPGDIPYGSTYTSEINKAIKKSSCFVILLSESAQESTWVLKETERAVSFRKPVFTILLDDVPMNDDFEIMLSTSQAIAIRKIDDGDKKIKQFIATIKIYTEEKQPEQKNQKIKTSHKSKITDYELINNNSGNGSVFFKVLFSTKSGGALFIYSSDCYDKNDKRLFEFTEAMWNQFTKICKKLVASCFPGVSYDNISIKRLSKLGVYECAPDDGHNYYDSKYRINFEISYRITYDISFLKRKRLLKMNESDLYDSVRFEIGENFKISLYKNGECVFLTTPEQVDLSYFGINADELRTNSIEMLKFSTQSDNIVVSDNFREHVYSDGYPDVSCRFVLDYIINNENIDSVNFSSTNPMSTNNKDTSIPQANDIVFGEFQKMFSEIYQILINYRKAFQKGEENSINESTVILQQNLQKIYLMAERYRYTQKESAEIAFEMISQFNRYATHFTAFVNSSDRLSEKSQAFAKQAELEFSKLIDITVKALSADK